MQREVVVLKDAVDHAQDKNVLLVVAAGNDSQNIDKEPVYPAVDGDSSNILTVAASTDTDTLASFSNFGSTAVDVAAPAIRSTRPISAAATSTYRARPWPRPTRPAWRLC